MSTKLDAALAEALVHVSDEREAFVDSVAHITEHLTSRRARSGELRVYDLDAVAHSARMLLESVEDYRLVLAVADALAKVARAEGE